MKIIVKKIAIIMVIAILLPFLFNDIPNWVAIIVGICVGIYIEPFNPNDKRFET